MRFSLAYNEDGSFLVASSGDLHGQRPLDLVETTDLFPRDRLRDADPNEGLERPLDDVADTEAEILMSDPLRRPRWRFLAMALLAMLAVVALRIWLPSSNSVIETQPLAPSIPAVLPPWAPAEPPPAPPAPAQANDSLNAATLNHPTAYIQFCWNSPSMCAKDLQRRSS
jgi:hypothetical protein